MASYKITVTGHELDDIVFSLRSQAAQRRRLVEACGDTATFAEQKAYFLAEVERLDGLAKTIRISAEAVR